MKIRLLQLKGLAPQESFFKYLEDRQTAGARFVNLLNRDPMARLSTKVDQPEGGYPPVGRQLTRRADVVLDNLQAAQEIEELFKAGFEAGFILTDIVALARLDAWEKWVWRGWNLEWPYHQMVRNVELMEIQQLAELKVVLDVMGALKIQVEVVRQLVKKIDEAVQVKQETRARLREAVDVTNFSVEELREFISSGLTSMPNRYLNPNSEDVEILDEEADDEGF